MHFAADWTIILGVEQEQLGDARCVDAGGGDDGGEALHCDKHGGRHDEERRAEKPALPGAMRPPGLPQPPVRAHGASSRGSSSSERMRGTWVIASASPARSRRMGWMPTAAAPSTSSRSLSPTCTTWS